jgi:5'-phosphate synthase pdxT subunit
MVETVNIGVLGIQGDVSEHVNLMNRAIQEVNVKGKTTIVEGKEDISDIDALIIPGGESTTISKMLNKSGLFELIINKVKKENLPIMGTCAGCVLLAKEIIDSNIDIRTLQAMDIQVKRNAFGRQRESFEQELKIKGFSEPYHAVFIRAPVITKINGNCEVLSKKDGKIVAARQNNYLALSFHPELTDDVRIHKYFIEMI